MDIDIMPKDLDLDVLHWWTFKPFNVMTIGVVAIVMCIEADSWTISENKLRQKFPRRNDNRNKIPYWTLMEEFIRKYTISDQAGNITVCQELILHIHNKNLLF